MVKLIYTPNKNTKFFLLQWYSPFKKKNVWLWGGGAIIIVRHFTHRVSYLSNLLLVDLSGLSFLSSSLQLIAYSIISLSLSPSLSLSLSLVFVSLSTFTQQKFAYDVGLVSTYSVHWHSTFFPIFADIEFKESLLISLLYTPNKVLPSFCWNLHLTLVHCHRYQF